MTKVRTYVFSERGDRMLGTELSCCSWWATHVKSVACGLKHRDHLSPKYSMFTHDSKTLILLWVRCYWNAIFICNFRDGIILVRCNNNKLWVNFEFFSENVGLVKQSKVLTEFRFTNKFLFGISLHCVNILLLLLYLIIILLVCMTWVMTA